MEDLEGRWKQAQEYRTAMCDRMYHTLPCGCCGNRVPKSTMRTGVDEATPLHETETACLLDPLLSCDTENSTRVRLLDGTKDFCLHESYDMDLSVSLCKDCDKALSKGTLPRLCLKLLDIGIRPSVALMGEGCAPAMPLPDLTVVERMIVSPVKHTRYMTTAYNQTGQTQNVALAGHITAFPKPTPEKVDAALRKEFPASIAELGEMVSLVLVTAGSREEALQKARTIPELTVDGRKVHLWAKQMAHAWSQVDIPLLQASICRLHPRLACGRFALPSCCP